MSSGEVLISELFVSRRKEREEVAGRTVRNNGDSGKSFGNTVSSWNLFQEKKNPPFRRNNDCDQNTKTIYFLINYKIYIL